MQGKQYTWEFPQEMKEYIRIGSITLTPSYVEPYVTNKDGFRVDVNGDLFPPEDEIIFEISCTTEGHTSVGSLTITNCNDKCSCDGVTLTGSTLPNGEGSGEEYVKIAEYNGIQEHCRYEFSRGIEHDGSSDDITHDCQLIQTSSSGGYIRAQILENTSGRVKISRIALAILNPDFPLIRCMTDWVEIIQPPKEQ